MNINLEFDAQALAAPQSFRDGVQAAANIIDANFIDPITINITVGYNETQGQALTSNQVGAASASPGTWQFIGELKSLLPAHAGSADDLTAADNLIGHQWSLTGPFSSSIELSTAQSKALGLIAANRTSIDGSIGISSAETGNALINDALHQLTQAMGRESNGQSLLDLYSYVTHGVLAVENPLSSLLPKYFSLNNGWTQLAAFDTTGTDAGDFNVAPGATPTDPFQTTIGQVPGLTALDLIEMDVLGFTRPKQYGRAPEASFDPTYYASTYSDVASSGLDPQSHFDASGWHEGRNPNAFFNTTYYLANNPDVARSGMDPLLQYEQYGWKEGRNPSASLNTNSYLAHNPDVKLAGLNPLDHYVMYGQAEHRSL